MDDIKKCKPAIELLAPKEQVLSIILRKWSMMEEVLKIVKLFYDVTKQLQKLETTLSDVFGMLLALKQNLSDYIHSVKDPLNLAQCLLSELDKRLPLLVNHPSMLCALYLDRRFSSVLNADEIALAKLNFVKIWEKLQSFNIKEQHELSPKPFEFSDQTSAIDIFFASQNSQTSVSREPDFTKTEEMILNYLESIDKIGRLEPTTSVLRFWEEKKFTFPEIYLLSTVINSIPPTEGKNERDFSTLKFNEKRYKLSPDLLEDNIMLKLNKALVYEFFQNDLQSIVKKNEK